MNRTASLTGIAIVLAFCQVLPPAHADVVSPELTCLAMIADTDSPPPENAM